MGFQTDLITGYAVLLDAADVATWAPAGDYTEDQVGITVQAVPSSPAGLVALSTFPVSDDPSLSDSVLGLQVHVRLPGQDPRPVNDTADAIFDLLHGAQNLVLSTGVHVVECLHRSGALLGQDDLKRWSRADNYYLTVWRPSTNRT
jgi:hypothetical protein